MSEKNKAEAVEMANGKWMIRHPDHGTYDFKWQKWYKYSVDERHYADEPVARAKLPDALALLGVTMEEYRKDYL